MNEKPTSQAGERTQITPAPWKAGSTMKNGAIGGDWETLIHGDGATFVGVFQQGAMKSKEEALANASLVVAAPELLTALKIARDFAADLSLVRDGLIDRPYIKRLIDAVIAKAEGRA